MKKKILVLSVITPFILFAFRWRSPGAGPVAYPEGFKNWVHVKTGLLGPKSKFFGQFGGFHDIYANRQALIGYREGKFPKGSVLVFDKHEMLEDSSGSISEGKRKWLDVMVKDDRSDSTGGWSFEEFTGDSRTERTVKDLAAVKCFNCHNARRANDFVFSDLKE
jgi:Cytochrome P460